MVCRASGLMFRVQGLGACGFGVGGLRFRTNFRLQSGCDGCLFTRAMEAMILSSLAPEYVDRGS